MYAADYGLTETVLALSSAGADINLKNDAGWTCLMYAVAKGHIEVALALIGVGAYINLRNNDGKTAFEYSSEFNSDPELKRRVDEAIASRSVPAPWTRTASTEVGCNHFKNKSAQNTKAAWLLLVDPGTKNVYYRFVWEHTQVCLCCAIK